MISWIRKKLGVHTHSWKDVAVMQCNYYHYIESFNAYETLPNNSVLVYCICNTCPQHKAEIRSQERKIYKLELAWAQMQFLKYQHKLRYMGFITSEFKTALAIPQ